MIDIPTVPRGASAPRAPPSIGSIEGSVDGPLGITLVFVPILIGAAAMYLLAVSR